MPQREALLRSAQAPQDQIFDQVSTSLRGIHRNCSPAAFKGAVILSLATLTTKSVPEIMDLLESIVV